MGSFALMAVGSLGSSRLEFPNVLGKALLTEDGAGWSER